MRSPDDCKVCVDYSEDVVCRHCYEAALGALRTVAQRQRESCAAYLRNRMKEANEDHLSVDYVRGLRAAIVYADATPLVTEGDK